MSKFPISGKAIDNQSIDEREKLLRRNTVNNTPEDWHLVNFISFFFYLNQETAETINTLLTAMGVKIISTNVALTGLTTLPNYPDYTPQNRERLLLIAQTTATQNGFYEWQTGGNLVRLYDWRDIIAGNGITISENNIAVRLLEYLPLVLGLPQRNDNFLQFVDGKIFARIAEDAVGLKLNTNRELIIDVAELGTGGLSELDIPNPDIDNLSNLASEAIYLPNTTDNLEVIGGNFRTAPIGAVTLECDGIDSISYVVRKHNYIQASITVNNLIGSHIVTAKHLTQKSVDNDGFSNVAYNKITILGSANIDTVTPAAKRNDTTAITVTGEGFGVFSEWAANNIGITIANYRFLTRLLIEIDIAVDNTVASGLYNLVCTNAYSGLGSFDSGTTGNNKLQVFGDPQITTVFRTPEGSQIAAEIGLGETFDIVANGFDLGTDPNVSASIADITVNSISGTTNKKTINVTGSTNKALIGIKNLLITDTTLLVDSGTSGNDKVALNYAYDATTARIPTAFRAYGGATLADWTITSDANSVTVTKTGGSGDCGLEITDLFLVASLLQFNLGGSGTFINIEVLTPATLIDVANPLYIMIAKRNQNHVGNTAGGDVDYGLRIQDAAGGFYNYFDNNVSTPSGISSSNNNARIRFQLSALFSNSNFSSEILSSFGGSVISGLGGSINKNYTAHENKGLYISMRGNYSIRFNMIGWIGD